MRALPTASPASSGAGSQAPTQIEVQEVDNPEKDATSARLVYSWIQGLTPTLAMEERLWAYLTHQVFPEHMAARWPVTGTCAIQLRYLVEGKGFAASLRNGISRLWWAGFLTHDPAGDNPFELTDVLFMQRDVQVSLLERALGKCRTVRTAVLEYLRNHQDRLATEAFGRRIQLLLEEVNLLGGGVVLDALATAELSMALEELGERLQDEAP